MPNRLPIDANVVGYWGFDEANDTDSAIDESSNGLTLTFSGSPVAVSSRIGNARQFDGSSVVAQPSSSTLLQISDGLSVIVWINITSLNSGGSLLRTIVACDGTTTGSGDNTQYNLSVDNTGAFVFRHDHGSGVPVVFKTAAGTLTVNRFYSIALSRTSSGGVATVLLFINNILVPWASITDNGVTTSSPPVPTGGSTAIFKVGKSAKASDSAFWSGLVDELSVHNTARTYQPYFVAAYYRVALGALSSRFSVFNNVNSVGSFEMGGGSRWWTYERDQNLFVVRENSLGLFSAEVQLTTGTSTFLGAPVPAEASQPELYYDAPSDTLFVSFLSANKIWKLTATGEDAPSTQNMPFTGDTSTIVKLQDSTEATRIGGGTGDAFTLYGANGDGGAMSEITPLAPVIQYIGVPSFGVAINNANSFGYALFLIRGGAAQRVATLTSPYFGNGFNGTYYFFAVSHREFGDQYYALPIKKSGALGLNYSNVITDWLGQVVPFSPGSINLKVDSDGGDIPDFGAIGGGEPNEKVLEDLVTYVNRTPLKVNFTDAGVFTIGGGESESLPLESLVSYVNRTPIKLNFSDPDTPSNTIGAGGTDHLQVGGTGRTAIIL